MTPKQKIVNDPVYGFIRFPEAEVMDIIEHPWFQRLRYVKQMGLAHLVYPGAVHTRFHHSLGACHLIGKAMDELSNKEVPISKEECLAARLAILLHDIGHGPFSHALEYSLVEGIRHEQLSLLIMQRLNEHYNGALDTAIPIFNNTYHKQFLHQLVSSQLDVDRMDYLNRDSFFTGVSEGVIGYDRILQMLTVKDGRLMVEEKAIHSVEKFIIARRLMYWQVYLHKTVLGAEMLVINILRRAKELALSGRTVACSPVLTHFLNSRLTIDDFRNTPQHLELFCQLDDTDVLAAVKVWRNDEDPVLSRLCRMLLERRLYKVRLSSGPLESFLAEKLETVGRHYGFGETELPYFVFSGVTTNNTYNTGDDQIQVAMKNGATSEISEVENAIISQTLALPVRKNYVCYLEIPGEAQRDKA